MIVLQVNDLTKFFGADLVLSKVKLELQKLDRVALVGRNGAGKSTLLKMIAGEMSFDQGEIIKPKDVSIGYLAQNTDLQSEQSIWEEMISVFASLRQSEKKLRELEIKMGDPTILSNPAAYEKLLKEYDLLQISFKDQGGYQYEADIRSVLHGLQFGEFDYQTPISSLSGGQKTRLALGKLLLTKPELLLLDEPTNHLDIETLTWLEQYLQGYPGAILIVSHDRYFLDKVVNSVYEVSQQTTKKFKGNYSQYLKEKAKQYELESKLYEKQQEEVAKLKDFVQKNLARASTTKRAQSRRKQLEKIDLLDRPSDKDKSASFSFEISRQSGNDVLIVQDVKASYTEDKSLFENVKFHLFREDSVALVGPNGIGKSTLLKGIVKQIPQVSGKISFGSNVKISYYDQEQADLHSNKTVINELWDEYPTVPEKDIRTILGNFLFSGDDVLKSVSSLSGGQKARLSLAKLMLERANVLILDEPTNHLDLDSKEVLENALIDYPGTILFVSHDRYFMNRIATKIFELSPKGVSEYLGDYDYYVEKKLELEEIALENKTNIQKVEIKQPSNDYLQDKEFKKRERQRKRRIEELEQEIEELEETIQEKETSLANPELYHDYNKLQELQSEIDQFKATLEQLLSEWEELQIEEN